MAVARRAAISPSIKRFQPLACPLAQPFGRAGTHWNHIQPGKIVVGDLLQMVNGAANRVGFEVILLAALVSKNRSGYMYMVVRNSSALMS